MTADPRLEAADAPHLPHRTRQLWGGGLILCSSLCFGGVVVLGKLALHRLPVFPVLAIRYTVSAILLLAIITLSGRRRTLSVRDRTRLIVLGLTGDALSAWLFFAALTLGSVPIVSVLFFTYPVLVVLISPRGTRTWPVIVGLISALLGVSVMLGIGQALAITRLGMLLIFAAAVVYAGFLVGTEHAVRHVHPLASSFWLTCGTAAGLWLCAGISGTALLPTGAGQWATVTAMGAATAASIIFFVVGLGLMGALRTSILGASEPLATTALAIIFLHERLSVPAAIGGALVIFGGAAVMLPQGAAAVASVSSHVSTTHHPPARDRGKNPGQQPHRDESDPPQAKAKGNA
jgi:drug/metabolite transporter (DMT)-like permease